MFTAKHAAGACALVAMVTSSLVFGEDTALLPVCTSDAIGVAHRIGARSVVEVRAPGVHGLGFVFGSTRYVATAFSLVENGRGIEVVFGDDTLDAAVVAFSRTHDLAILRLERPHTAAPLGAARRALAVGEPVLALGHTSDADVVVTPGMITSSKLRSDALDGPQVDWGGPVLDCAGDVVAVATRDGEHLASGKALDDLFNSVDDQTEPYEGGWSILHPSLTFHGQIDAAPSGADRPDGWLGFGLGTALIGDDRWYFPFEARALLLAGPHSPQPLVYRTGVRLQLASAMGYRFLLSSAIPAYLMPTLGGALSYDTVTTTSAQLTLEPGCTESCRVKITTDEDTTSRLRLMPTAGLKLQLGFTTVGYEFALDVETPAQSIHQLSVGLQF